MIVRHRHEVLKEKIDNLTVGHCLRSKTVKELYYKNIKILSLSKYGLGIINGIYTENYLLKYSTKLVKRKIHLPAILR